MNDEEQWQTSSDPGRLIGCLPIKSFASSRMAFIAACVTEAATTTEIGVIQDCQTMLDHLHAGIQFKCSCNTCLWHSGQRGERGPYRWITCSDVGMFTKNDMMRAMIERYSMMRSKKRKYLLELEQLHLQFLRCVFGNPFRPVAFDRSWQSESAVALARTAYDTRNFTLLPILADALEEAGCDHPDVLTHCRQPDATHVRGCWVVDLVLGKA